MGFRQRISIKDCAIYVDGTRIGGAEEATFAVTADNEEAFEADNYFPVEIVDGKKHIAGTITRAFLDVELLETICPMDSTGLWPEMTIVGVQTKKTPIRNITVTGAKFDGFEISELGLDGYAKNPLNWKGTGMSFS